MGSTSIRFMTEPSGTSHHNRMKRAFTLIEVLTVLAIIAIIAALILPFLGLNIGEKIGNRKTMRIEYIGSKHGMAFYQVTDWSGVHIVTKDEPTVITQ